MRGKKTSPKDIYAVMASYAITDNLSETSRILDIPKATVKDIVDKNKDKPEFERLRTQKREDFAEKSTRIIDKALKRLESSIDDEDTAIPINHLTTAIGTLYDKRALAQGENTGKIEVEIKLPEGIDEYAG